MNNNRLSSNVLPGAAGESQTTNLDSTQHPLQLLTEREVVSTEENYNLLVAKVKTLLIKPSKF